MNVTDKLPEPLDLFEAMQFMRNKYRDYGQTIKFDSYVYFFQDKWNIIGFNTLTKNVLLEPCQLFNNTTVKDFSTAIHFKDLGKPTQTIQSLLLFNFNQYPMKREANEASYLKNSSKS